MASLALAMIMEQNRNSIAPLPALAMEDRAGVNVLTMTTEYMLIGGYPELTLFMLVFLPTAQRTIYSEMIH